MTVQPTDPSPGFDPIPEVLDALRRGEVVLVSDDESRENEGDLIVAADHGTPEIINFLTREGRGLVCVAMAKPLLDRFVLHRMPQRPGDRFRTAFMESVDAARGVTTGISAPDRARTVKVLIDPGSGPEDLSRPGHVFPLEAVAGGVLRRPGHTESAVDLTRLAGLTPAGVICEVLREDGDMARLPDLRALAGRAGIRLASVADLIRYRCLHEELVRFEREVRLPTPHGEFRLRMYYSEIEEQHHLALVMGDPAQGPAPLVRIHSECLTGDVFGSRRCDCGAQLDDAMARIAGEGRGAVLYMRQEGRGIGLSAKIHAYALQEEGADTVEANRLLGFAADLREYSACGHILKDLGVTAVRLLTNNPAKVEGIRAHGIGVEDRLPVPPVITRENRRYLDTKREKLGHLL